MLLQMLDVRRALIGRVGGEPARDLMRTDAQLGGLGIFDEMNMVQADSHVPRISTLT